MPRALFGIDEHVVLDISPAAPTPTSAQVVIGGRGALVDTRSAFHAEHPHPYLSAIVVLHAGDQADDYFKATLAQQHDARPPRSHDERRENGVMALRTFEDAAGAGQVPHGEYQWLTVFDLSGHPQFDGIPLPEHVFDGRRDQRYGLTPQGTFALRH